MRHAIDDRDVIINQGSGHYRTPWRLLGSLAGVILLLALVVILFGQIRSTFDPLERDRQREAIYAEQDRAERLTWADDLAGVAWRLLPVLLLAGGGVVGLVLVYQRWATVASIQAHYQVKAIEARYNVQVPQHYAPHFAGLGRAEPMPAPEVIDLPALPEPTLPGVTDLATLNYRPTKEAILLGLGPNSEQITVPLGKLWHVATAGPTGNGKSNIHRLLLAQLCALGAHVAIGDPKWTPYDQEQNEDWRPIERRLHLAPAVSADQIGALLDYATGELAKRLERRRKQEPIGRPLFVALDELPWIYDHVRAADEQIAELVRLGRGVGVFTLAAAQDFLVKSTGLGAARDNFRSAFYLGGDLKTGSVLLDTPQRELAQREHEIAFGTAMLRSSATTPPQIVRVPYVSNSALYALLGAGANAGANVGASAGAAPVIIDAERTEARTENDPTFAPTGPELGTAQHKAVDARSAQVRDLLRAKKGVNEILREIWQLDTTKKGAEYKAALAEYQDIVARLIG